ncbi:uncharacterized protein BP5553_06795 [Venustampulla echinocandica]|uniref:NAD(P)-binding protein n=1 Tax=Venustampulla echinocandica TaxID=2656787 RepID=A0A370TKY5_9HELO|nr:uncharacterized protein BP5553_06795 [Venustampulla echinocandica]RDL36183.1 hypothetical protein BP5553_06795 [Venustampulla echinocandica]
MAGNSKSIIVTGGLSGIGLAEVTLMSSASNKIAVLDISPTLASSVLIDLRSKFPQTTFLFKKADVSSWDEQAAAFEEVHKEFGSIDVVFANAGVSEIGEFLERSEDASAGPTKPNLKTLDIDLSGLLYTVRLAVHYMRKNATSEKGSIICTASNAGIYAFPAAPMYGVAKHGVVGAVRSLAEPLSKEGIRINGICPNVIRTGLASDHLFEAMQLTPMQTALDAIEAFLNDSAMTGGTAEISGEKFTLREAPAFIDDITAKNFVVFGEKGA